MTTALFQTKILVPGAEDALTGKTSARSTGHTHRHMTSMASHTRPSAVDLPET